jgi:hypothetical protein
MISQLVLSFRGTNYPRIFGSTEIVVRLLVTTVLTRAMTTLIFIINAPDGINDASCIKKSPLPLQGEGGGHLKTDAR